MRRLHGLLMDRIGVILKNRMRSAVPQFKTFEGNENSFIDDNPFLMPAVAPKVELSQGQTEPAGLRGSFHFQSRLSANDPKVDTCRGEFVIPNQPNGINLLVIHGWKSNSLNSVHGLLTEPLARMGYNLYFMELPHHLHRVSEESTFSGEYMISANIERTVAAFRQAVTDAADLLAWFKAQNTPCIVIGTSLGGLVSNLLACYTDSMDGLISIMYATDLAELIWKSPMGKHIKKELKKNRITPTNLSAYWSVLNPSKLEPLISKDKIMLISGKYDVFIPDSDSLKLQEQWGIQTRVILPCGHSGMRYCREGIINEIIPFLERCL